MVRMQQQPLGFGRFGTVYCLFGGGEKAKVISKLSLPSNAKALIYRYYI